MGAVLCRSDPDSLHSKHVSQMLYDLWKAEPRKLLLLGPGEAGKSTIFRQVKRIHDNGFDENARASYIAACHANIVEGIKKLIAQAMLMDVAWTEEGYARADRVLKRRLDEKLTSDFGDDIEFLWKKENAISVAFEQRDVINLGDSVSYFLDRVSMFADPTYVPSEEDIVHVRVRTSGISELKFVMHRVPFLVVDIGGQRGERKKWIHCFDGVHAVLFVVAISEFDRVMSEDMQHNRLADAVQLFENVANSDHFKMIPMILFLNKKDLFFQKLNQFVQFFPQYTGGLDRELAIKFCLDMFIRVRKTKAQPFYHHVTCATDKDQVDFVFQAVKDIVLNANIENSGFA